jgi:hypothetical protein
MAVSTSGASTLSVGLTSNDEFALLQASIFHGPSLDPLALVNDALIPTKVNTGGCRVVRSLVMAPVVLAFDKRFKLRLKVAG